MNNTRLQRILTSASLVTQAFGFSTLGSLMILRGWSDSGARIGGLLAVLTGTMFLRRIGGRSCNFGDVFPGPNAMAYSVFVLRAMLNVQSAGELLAVPGRCKQRPSRGWLISGFFSRINF
jgi:hypothetical protein